MILKEPGIYLATKRDLTAILDVNGTLPFLTIESAMFVHSDLSGCPFSGNEIGCQKDWVFIKKLTPELFGILNK